MLIEICKLWISDSYSTQGILSDCVIGRKMSAYKLHIKASLVIGEDRFENVVLVWFLNSRNSWNISPNLQAKTFGTTLFHEAFILSAKSTYLLVVMVEVCSFNEKGRTSPKIFTWQFCDIFRNTSWILLLWRTTFLGFEESGWTNQTWSLTFRLSNYFAH